jgi:co-chaperonin GroES (HSP10)
MKSNIRPRFDCALIELLPDKDHFSEKAGIVKPENAKNTGKMLKGLVLKVGSGCDQLEVGMHVGFRNGAGEKEIDEENKNLMLIRDKDLMLIYE